MTSLKKPKNLKLFPLNDKTATLFKKRYYLKDAAGRPIENVDDMFWRIASSIAAEDAKYGHKSAQDIMDTAIQFYDIMVDQIFLPNSPTIMNAGKPDGQLSACFVLPVGDSIEEIFNAIKHAALIHKSGGGTGFSFSRLRPKDSTVRSTGGIASGPLSFLKIFNTATEQIKQGGTRRGANMGILRVDHPDIIEFIRAKEVDGELNNFNLSVGITDKFMDALEEEKTYELVNPQDGKVVAEVPAKEVWDLLVDRAWLSGDPGIIFIDSINRDNPTPELGEIEATNPCGEQPLLPYEACNLGSLNLVKFVNRENKTILFNKLQEAVQVAVHFLDNVISANCYPLEQIAEKVNATRKIGLGVMGFADMLFELGIPYDSDEAIRTAEEVMGAINLSGRKASQELAIVRGPYPAYTEERGYRPQRNATVTTIAPTGSLSIIADCSGGIEPIFALCFTKNILGGEKFLETNQFLQNKLQELGLDKPEILEKIAAKGTIQDIEEIPEELRRVCVTAQDIAPEWHMKMQAAFQKYTDNAVSKTINLPNSATREDIDYIYRQAYELGCKGTTVYRDGCKSIQVFATGERQKKMTGEDTVKKERPTVMRGFTQKVQTGLGTMYLTVNELDGEPFEVFAIIGKSGHSITAKTEAIGRLISLALRSGVSVREIVTQLKGIGGEHPTFREKGMVLSIPDAIAWILADTYLKNDAPVKAAVPDLTNENCPDCGHKLNFQEGCAHCPACGYSKCG